jgi:predicted restriction endonuclease
MAKLEKITSSSWKQSFKDRKNNFSLWKSHKEVAEHCKLVDGVKRLLNIQFENHNEINVTDHFRITSGKEISFPKEFENLIKPIILSNPRSYFIVRVLDVEPDDETDTCFPTTGSATIKTRIGQTQFRNKLLEYWQNRCAVTGIELKEILKASHIKPWSASSDSERLDMYNGLLLVPTLDSLFDKGLITFDSKGLIQFSSNLTPLASNLGINSKMKIKIDNMHEKYLHFHRNNVFKK